LDERPTLVRSQQPPCTFIGLPHPRPLRLTGAHADIPFTPFDRFRGLFEELPIHRRGTAPCG
ncbi:MAG TPA: hypothetical protein QF901_08745, partial [Gammaproteobacteria bacterium]|nr:hypothetical protein [Gammaproteobacteria bacterium]